eukprot:scaffold29824_cov130-Isochrysis_galbana.AAC.3
MNRVVPLASQQQWRQPAAGSARRCRGSSAAPQRAPLRASNPYTNTVESPRSQATTQRLDGWEIMQWACAPCCRS